MKANSQILDVTFQIWFASEHVAKPG